MGILHSTSRIFGCKPEDEEDKWPISPYPLHRRQNNFNPHGDSSAKLPRILNLGSSIYNAIRRLLQRVHLFFSFRRPRRSADPSVLPVQINRESSICRKPLLVPSAFISSPTDDPHAPPSAFDSETDEEELQREIVEALPVRQWRRPEASGTANGDYEDSVMVSIPDFTLSLAYASAREVVKPSAVCVERERTAVCVERKTTAAEEEEKVQVKKIVVVREERWITHYSNRQRILLVGDGDFSFSASLAVAFGCASNIIATSLDSQAFLKENYPRALSNIEKLRSRESKVMHEIDSTKMANHPLLGHLKFDRIIFNFPYAGLRDVKNLPRESQLRRHRKLVEQFLKNAREMIGENGEIHITHKTNYFHLEFKLEFLASTQRLKLIEAIKFNYLDYPGYRTKCGFGGDRFFNCNPSKTYRFGPNKALY